MSDHNRLYEDHITALSVFFKKEVIFTKAWYQLKVLMKM